VKNAKNSLPDVVEAAWSRILANSSAVQLPAINVRRRQLRDELGCVITAHCAGVRCSSVERTRLSIPSRIRARRVAHRAVRSRSR
jgi:hypothetical protein